jgi:hypothetical protein
VGTSSTFPLGCVLSKRSTRVGRTVGCMASSSPLTQGACGHSLRWRFEAMGHAPPPHGASPRPMPASHPHRHRPCRDRRGLAVLRAHASRASARGEEAGTKSAQHAVPHGALTALARCSCGGIARLATSPVATPVLGPAGMRSRPPALPAPAVALASGYSTRVRKATVSCTLTSSHGPTPWPPTLTHTHPTASVAFE